ncbi:MAG TPA: hypothetical protein VNJ08_00925 [Bacteriovoracaceae bacterium]|nr:hypothetical protein [Bacteriovoracaceae bacterium]
MKITLFLLLFAACKSTEELNFTKEQLFAKAKEGDPTLQFVLPKTMNDGVHCTDYAPGCLSGHTVKVKGLDLIAVEFMNEDQAILGAKKVKGYYTRNWVLDDVSGEPILEKFAEEILEAKKP